MLPRPDLVIQDLPPRELRSWLEPWRWRLSGHVTPLFLNRFGCWFFERGDGRVEMLEVFFGQVEPIASSLLEFQSAINDPAWQAVYLLSEFVGRLHSAGKVASGISCYALAPHPSAGGTDPWADSPLDTNAVMLLDAPVWQGICSQLIRTAQEAGTA